MSFRLRLVRRGLLVGVRTGPVVGVLRSLWGLEPLRPAVVVRRRRLRVGLWPPPGWISNGVEGCRLGVARSGVPGSGCPGPAGGTVAGLWERPAELGTGCPAGPVRLAEVGLECLEVGLGCQAKLGLRFPAEVRRPAVVEEWGLAGSPMVGLPTVGSRTTPFLGGLRGAGLGARVWRLPGSVAGRTRARSIRPPSTCVGLMTVSGMTRRPWLPLLSGTRLTAE